MGKYAWRGEEERGPVGLLSYLPVSLSASISPFLSLSLLNRTLYYLEFTSLQNMVNKLDMENLLYHFVNGVLDLFVLNMYPFP